MLGGYDKCEGASLYLIDYLASMIEVPFTTNGYGGLITLSILDRYYKPGMYRTMLRNRSNTFSIVCYISSSVSDLTPEAAYNLILKCVQEIHKRLVLNLPNFKVTVVDKNGIRNFPEITPRTEPMNWSYCIGYSVNFFLYFIFM